MRNIFLCLLFTFVFVDYASAAKKCGKASWYALKGRTASGERNNPNAMTAAHKRLRFGRIVTVKNMRNGRTVKVRINDRGPFKRGRIIDVSRAAASKLGFRSRGIARVCIFY
ncbi:MAG: septal ring lytic transglycosylase RlpA family protein [Methyloligellaceae bacterium]